MTDIQNTKRLNRTRRHKRIRAKISGTDVRPRIAIFKSNQHITAQAINDVARVTIAAATDRNATRGTKTEHALAVGKELAKQLHAKKIERAVFDSGGFAFHGRVKAVADGLREGGVQV